MFICVCKAVSDRQIRRAVREDGVCTLRELKQQTGLGSCCGKCVPQARALLGEALADRESLLLPAPALGAVARLGSFRA